MAPRAADVGVIHEGQARPLDPQGHKRLYTGHALDIPLLDKLQKVRRAVVTLSPYCSQSWFSEGSKLSDRNFPRLIRASNCWHNC